MTNQNRERKAIPLPSRNAPFSPARRKVLLQGTSLAAVALMASIAGGPAFAHHGWASFDTRHAYFAAGTVTYVRWWVSPLSR
jgi:hypothetical protein